MSIIKTGKQGDGNRYSTNIKGRMRLGRNRFASEVSQSQCTSLGLGCSYYKVWTIGTAAKGNLLLVYGDMVGKGGYCQSKGL